MRAAAAVRATALTSLMELAMVMMFPCEVL